MKFAASLASQPLVTVELRGNWLSSTIVGIFGSYPLQCNTLKYPNQSLQYSPRGETFNRPNGHHGIYESLKVQTALHRIPTLANPTMSTLLSRLNAGANKPENVSSRRRREKEIMNGRITYPISPS